MARPTKRGLSLFLFPVDFFVDRQVLRLCRRQGVKSLIIYIGILCMIYKEGYYLLWDEDAIFDVRQFLSILQLSDDEIILTVECCVTLGLFSNEMLDKHHILTSLSIQENYQCACDKYKRKFGVSEHSLLQAESTENSASNGLLGVKQEETNVESEKTRIISEETPITSEEPRVSSNNIEYNIIGNKSKENYYSYSPEEEEQQELIFIYQLFFRNYQGPNREFKKFKDFNNCGGRCWAKMSKKQRQSALDLWKQEPAQSLRFGNKDAKFPIGWKPIVDKMFELRAPVAVIRAALSDDLAVRAGLDGIFSISCSVALRDYIYSNMDIFRPLLNSNERILGCSETHFFQCKNNK